MNRLAIVLVLAVSVFTLLCLSPAISLAENDEEALDYAWGVVKNAASDSITVTEYSYETDTEVDIAYTVDPKAEFVNVKSLSEITAGDDVEIDYKEEGGKRIAMTIDVEKASVESENIQPDESTVPALPSD